MGQTFYGGMKKGAQTALKGRHPFCLVEPSAWPITTALAVLLTAIGAVLYMHHVDVWLLVGGAVFLVANMVLWWRDVVRESVEHTPAVRTGLRWGIVLLIASEFMFFFGFFWGYFNAALMPTEAIGSVWPPRNIVLMDAFDLPYLNTLILLLSSATLTWAHHGVMHQRREEASRALLVTVALGVLFVCLQALEYSHAAFAMKDGIYPSLFFMLTGFHGLHVIVGTIFLAVCWVRLKQFQPDHHVGLEGAVWYWHFVDVVWIFLFLAVYVYPNG